MSEGLRVLLVDDDELVLRSLRRILERAGHHVITRSSVSSAQEIVGSTDLDVVISDYWMVDGTGTDVADALRRMRPEVRIVLLSGDRVCVVAGIEVLQKPVRARELLEALR